MLVSTKLFRELEFFRGLLSPDLLDSQRRAEENHLRELEALRKDFDQSGAPPVHIAMKPFEPAKGPSQEAPCNTAPATQAGGHSLGGRFAFPRVLCGAHHCALLIPDGELWLWGRNDCLQLSKEKPVSLAHKLNRRHPRPCMIQFISH